MTEIRPFSAPAALVLLAICGALPAPADAQRSDARPYARQTMEQDKAHSQRERGEIRSFNELLPQAHRAAGPSDYIGVEPDIGRSVYRFKFMRPDGRMVWVDMDGRTARVLAVH